MRISWQNNGRRCFIWLTSRFLWTLAEQGVIASRCWHLYQCWKDALDESEEGQMTRYQKQCCVCRLSSPSSIHDWLLCLSLPPFLVRWPLGNLWWSHFQDVLFFSVSLFVPQMFLLLLGSLLFGSLFGTLVDTLLCTLLCTLLFGSLLLREGGFTALHTLQRLSFRLFHHSYHHS